MEDGELSSSCSSDLSDNEEELRCRTKQQVLDTSKKINSAKLHIWNEVLAEQLLSTAMTGIGDSYAKDREVESYDFKRALLDTRPSSNNNFQTSNDSPATNSFSIEGEETAAKVPSSDDLETFGVTTQSKISPKYSQKSSVRKRKTTIGQATNCKHFKGNEARCPDDTRGGSDCAQREEKKSVKDRLGYMKMEWDELRADKLNGKEEIVEELITVLHEPDHMKQTFGEIFSVLGGKRSLDLLRDTYNVERNGGMMTLKGDRRRTPGGVYLYLLKTSSSQQEQKLIFNSNTERPNKSCSYKKVNNS